MTLQSDYTVGLSKETTYGTYVAPTRFLEADSTLKENVTTAAGAGVRPGKRVLRGARRPIVKRECSGEITLDAVSRGLGLLLNAFFGVNTVTQIGATGVYQQVHTLKTADFSESFTVQVGIPRLGSATTDAYTYKGAQCSTLALEAAADSIITLNAGFVAKELTLAETYAAPSYPADWDLLTFVGGSIYLGGTAFVAPTTTALASAGTVLANVRNLSLSLDNGLDSNGFNLGGGGRRSRPAAYTGNKEDALGGSMTIEYTDRTFVDAYLAQTDLCMIANFEGPAEISAGVKPVLQVSFPLARLNGDIPTPNGGDVITVNHAFAGLAPASGEPVYAVYRSLDTAI
jgi:tail tube protein